MNADKPPVCKDLTRSWRASLARLFSEEANFCRQRLVVRVLRNEPKFQTGWLPIGFSQNQGNSFQGGWALLFDLELSKISRPPGMISPGRPG
jgi:hypothetical protein